MTLKRLNLSSQRAHVAHRRNQIANDLDQGRQARRCGSLRDIKSLTGYCREDREAAVETPPRLRFPAPRKKRRDGGTYFSIGNLIANAIRSYRP